MEVIAAGVRRVNTCAVDVWYGYIIYLFFKRINLRNKKRLKNKFELHFH